MKKLLVLFIILILSVSALAVWQVGDTITDDYDLTDSNGEYHSIHELNTAGKAVYSNNDNGIDIPDFMTQSIAGAWIGYFEVAEVMNPNEAPSNLAAEVMDNDVYLTWDYSAGGEPVVLAWDDGINNDGIGIIGGGDFMVASRWTPTELLNYHEMIVTSINFFLREETSAFLTLKVWTGADAANEIISLDLANLTPNGWNEIVLPIPVIIDAADELWFGYTITGQLDGEHPAGCDAGPAVTGYGDMICMAGETWEALSEVDSDLDYNWNLQAIVSGLPLMRNSVPETAQVTQMNNDYFSAGNLGPAAFRNRALLGFSIRRDGDEIVYLENTTARSYDDMDLADGTYEYYITAVYDEGISDPSNQVEAIIYTGVILDPPVALEVTNNGLASWFAPCSGGELLSEDFETWAPAGWIFLDEDNDGYMWEDGNAIGYSAYEGSGMATSASYINDVGAVEPDNWLISPAIEFSMTGQIQYYVAAQDLGWAGEHYGVYISTTGTDPADFDLLFEETMIARNGGEKVFPKGSSSREQGAWYERCVSTSGYIGTCYIAFRHFNSTDMFYLDLDSITISEGIMRPLESYNVYLDGNLECNTTDTFFQFTGLVESSIYEASVSAIYTEGESDPIVVPFTYRPTANDGTLPMVTALTGNYPNPFNPQCTISYSIANNAPVELNIYNARGQHVRTLVNKDMEAGAHQVIWNGTDDDGNGIASGIYYYKMNSGKFTSSKKMVLMK